MKSRKEIYNKLVIILIFALSIGMTNCSEDFLMRSPEDSPNPANFFVGEQSARQAVTAAYNPWIASSQMYGRDIVIMFDAMTDDSYWRPSRSASIRQARWDIFPTHNAIGSYWQNSYQSINAANFALEGIPTSTNPTFSEEQEMKYMAEARFMRGFSYLFLVTLFGDVPLADKVLTNFDEFNQPRAPKEEIYNLIIDDFSYAKENLPEQWPQDYSGRPAKAAAAGFLTKAYLFKNDFENAESSAREAITIAENTGYGLLDDYPSIFTEENEGNREILFAFNFVKNDPDISTNATVQRNPRDVPPEFSSIIQGWGYALPQRSLYDAYEPGDPRREYTIMAPGGFFGIYNGNETIQFEHEIYDEEQGKFVTYTKTYAPGDSVDYDYRWSPSGMNTRKMSANLSDLANVRWSGVDQPILRMAELYLFLAEALAEQGDNEALEWVNKVRSRPSVDMPDATLQDGNLVDVVRHERRVELAMEGVRLFDIMRWRNVGEIFGDGTKVKRHFYSDYLEDPVSRFDNPNLDLPTNYLFPIPQEEIDINDKINKNNPGY